MSNSHRLQAGPGSGLLDSHNTREADTDSSPAYVWPTDRSHRLEEGHQRVLQAFGQLQADQLQAASGLHSLVSSSSRGVQKQAGQDESPADAQHTFRWISDYLYASDDELPQGGQCSSQAGQQAPTVQPAGSRSSTVDTPAPSWPPLHLTQQQPTAVGTGRAAVPTSRSRRADAARTAGRAAHCREPLSRNVKGPGQTTAAAPSAAQEPLARAAGAAARAAQWLGAAASAGLDRLLGFDPALAADAPAARQHTPPRASQVQQQPQQREVEPSKQHEHRYFTRQAAQARKRPSASVQQQQQQQVKPQDQPEHLLQATPQQQQQQQPGSSASQGLLLALVLGIVALVSDIVTAITAAYTESLRPGAELLWHISAALVLYLLLPLLRLLLAAMKLVLRSLGWLLQAANCAIGRALHPRRTPHRLSRLRQLLMSACRRRQPCAGNKQQQQLVRLAEQHLCRLSKQYPGVLHPLEFATVYSTTGQFGPNQLLGPASGYGPRSYRGYGPAGQAVAVLVQQLDTQHDVEQWCAVVEALAALQQASGSAQPQETSSAGSTSTSNDKAPASALLQVFGAAVGAVPAAALQPIGPAAAAWLPAAQAPPLASAADVATAPTCQLQQQQGSCAVVVGLLAVQLPQQPTSLLSAARGADSTTPSTGTPGRVDARSDAGPSQAAAAAGAAGHPAADGAQCLAGTCRSLLLAPQVAAAVQSLCAAMAGPSLVTASPAHTGTPAAPAAAAQVSAALQDTSAVQLAAALVVSVPTAGQPARVWLNPAALLLQRQLDAVMREFEVQLLLSATRQLSQRQGNTGTAASWDAGAARAAGASAAGSCADGVQECMAKLEQCLCALQRCRPAQVCGDTVQLPTASAAPDQAATNSGSTEGGLVQSLSGVLLMLLTGNAGQGALLAPGAAVDPSWARALQQLQHNRLCMLLQQGSAASLAGACTADRQQQALVGSPQLTAAFDRCCEQALQQVLACWQWGSAGNRGAGCSNRSCAGPSDPGLENGGSLERVNGAPAGVHAAELGSAATSDAGQNHSAVPELSSSQPLWQGLQWLARRKRSPPAAGISPQDMPTPQQLEQQAAFDWSQLLTALQQVAQSAAVCEWLQRVKSQQPPAAYLCPISHELMKDPVVASDGHTYEKQAITKWIQACAARRMPCKSPMTLLPMQQHMVPNHTLRSLIKTWEEEHGHQC